MVSNPGGRPRAEELARRCASNNRLGKRCGMPPLPDEEVCAYHLVAGGKDGVDQHVSARERLTVLGMKALDTLETAMDNYRTNPAEAVRAAQIIADRTFPKPASTQAVVLNMNGPGPLDNRASAGDIIRARMAQLAAGTASGESAGAGDMSRLARDLRAEREREEDAAWRSAPPLDETDEADVIDAEIIPEPEPIAVQRVS